MTNSFKELQLLAPILRAVEELNYETPTPIQARAIPPLLEGRDLLGIAQTGTGKTAAFALPILDFLAGDPRPRKARRPSVLVLTPTRELAAQIGESFQGFSRHIDINHTVVFGGVGQAPQVKALQRGVDVLVATPGRLLDLIEQRLVDLQEIEVFVLDEADRMLDMGFIHDVRKVIAKLPKRRQTLLFSATMPDDIVKLSAKLLVDPVRVEVTPPATTVDRIEQSVMFVEKKQKRDVLGDVLQDKDIERALVFTRTKHGADRVVKHLVHLGENAAAIHGNKSQTARTRALDGFRNGKIRVLVATDIAARGIDVPGITHVINFDLPNIADSYVHRIGRTARAGRDGVAISFCDGEERAYLKDIERTTRQKIPVVDRPAAGPRPKVTKSPNSGRGRNEDRNKNRNRSRRRRPTSKRSA